MTVHGANGTLNKGASAVVGHGGGEGEKREREKREETTFCASREVLTMHREEREEQHFVDEKSTRLFESFTATPHIRLALRPTDGHAFICRRVLRSQQWVGLMAPGSRKRTNQLVAAY